MVYQCRGIGRITTLDEVIFTSIPTDISEGIYRAIGLRFPNDWSILAFGHQAIDIANSQLRAPTKKSRWWAALSDARRLRRCAIYSQITLWRRRLCLLLAQAL